MLDGIVKLWILVFFIVNVMFKYVVFCVILDIVVIGKMNVLLVCVMFVNNWVFIVIKV